MAGHAVAPSVGKKWTFLVYMDADNDLEQVGIENFQQMASVGPHDDVNIVVQMDRAQGNYVTSPDWTGTRRFLVTPGMTPDPGNNVSDLGEINMADPKNLTDFVNWGISQYPAQHYFLVLWDHGDGWQGVVNDNDPPGSQYPHQLTAAALRGAFQNVTAGRIDVIGNDACRMTLEIDYQLADYADYFVGSEKDEPFAGWPYDTWLSTVAANPSMSPTEVASTLVDKYVESYQGTSEYSVALSVVSAAALSPLVDALNGFLDELSSEEPYFTAEVVRARDATEHYEINGRAGGLEYDLYDFVENVIRLAPSRRIERVGTELKAAIEAAVVYERHWDNPTPVNDVHAAQAHGISLYFPSTGGAAGYDGLAFSQDSRWDEFLLTYAMGTRPQVAANATATSVDTNADGYLDTLILAYEPGMDGVMALDVYRDGAHVVSPQHAAKAGRADVVRYPFSAGGVYEVSFYLFAAGSLKNLTIVANVVVQQPILFRGRVLGSGGVPVNGASVTLANLANGNTATAVTKGGEYAIVVTYPTWFRDGDGMELRVVVWDREARLGFNASAGNGTVVHDLYLNALDIGAWIAALAILAAVAAAGVAGTVYFWRRLRRFKRIP